MQCEIKASFKELQIKSGTAVMKLEVLPSAKGFIDLTKMTGQVVFMSLESEQDEIPLEYEEECCETQPACYGEDEPRPANVDIDTGEVYEVIEDESRMIGDGYEAA